MTDDPAAAAAFPGAVEGRPAGVVHSAFALVRALREAPGPLGATDLASAVGIPKTTAHRVLEQMAQEGIVTRRDHKWAIAPGFGELMRAGERPSPLKVVARPRLNALAQATGASVVLHNVSDGVVDTVYCAYGPLLAPLVPAAEQRLAAVHPAASLWRALASGQVAAEYQEVHPGCICIAAPAALPSGGTVVASLARPENREVESLKRPLEKVVHLILSDERRLER
ncbi:helix-turn-helix domain-containing protein [Streptomyces sp. NBC_01455]|uniref:helix-turn-helix domain-containing protein n=1 Tax=Streptomyces sp. NBC_01455 TaxID=2903874 RepID=UPI002E352DE3|nr:helix-turn-helix domain-containing protein [Streptomyces sp. NBC_01455]